MSKEFTAAQDIELAASMIAHELRTPLASLATASELLIEDFRVLQPQQVQDMLTVIREGTLWLQGLVENVLCAASMREGRFQIQTQPISLIDVVLDIQPLVEPLLVQKAQRLQLSSRPALPAVAGDRRWLGHVLVNLIANASKYSPTNTPITVQLATRADQVRITVADRGPGIGEGGGEQLFAPGYRQPEAAQQDPRGAGLGLTIVKLIVAAHGGRVGAENRPAGGASVWLELASLSAAATARPGQNIEHGEAHESANGRRRR